MKIQALLLALCVSGTAFAQDDVVKPTWFADYDKALAHAKQEGKDLLIDFTGSDWCGWCIKLHDEVFDHAEFYGPASEKFVFVALDFPNGEEAKAKVPNPDRNQELSKKHGVRGFPTVLLMTNEEVVYAQTGYQAGGPEKYVESLNEFYANDRAQVMAVNAFAKKLAVDAPSAEILDEALTKLEAGAENTVVVGVLAPAIEKALGAGAWAKAEGGEQRPVAALVKAGRISETVAKKARELDPKNESGLLEKVIETTFNSVKDDATARAALAMLEESKELTFKDKELHTRLHVNAMMWLQGPLGDLAAAKKHAKLVLEMTDNERFKKMAQGVLDKEG